MKRATRRILTRAARKIRELTAEVAELRAELERVTAERDEWVAFADSVTKPDGDAPQLRAVTAPSAGAPRHEEGESTYFCEVAELSHSPKKTG